MEKEKEKKKKARMKSSLECLMYLTAPIFININNVRSFYRRRLKRATPLMHLFPRSLQIPPQGWSGPTQSRPGIDFQRPHASEPCDWNSSRQRWLRCSVWIAIQGRLVCQKCFRVLIWGLYWVEAKATCSTSQETAHHWATLEYSLLLLQDIIK